MFLHPPKVARQLHAKVGEYEAKMNLHLPAPPEVAARYAGGAKGERLKARGSIAHTLKCCEQMFLHLSGDSSPARVAGSIAHTLKHCGQMILHLSGDSSPARVVGGNIFEASFIQICDKAFHSPARVAPPAEGGRR